MANLLRGIVCAAFDFDGEPGGRTIEIENVGAEWMLSTKARAGCLSLAQGLPEEDFGQGHPGAHRARSLEG